MRCNMAVITCDTKSCRSRYVPDPAEPDVEGAAILRGWRCVDGCHYCPAHGPAQEPQPLADTTEYIAG